MKYLLLKRRPWSIAYELTEFATEAELIAEVQKEGPNSSVIVATRAKLEMRLGEWPSADDDF